jgi:phosphopantothenate synthetase
MKKIIDIPDEIVQDLKILAVKKNKDLKNFIQDELVQLVKDSKNKKNNGYGNTK